VKGSAFISRLWTGAPDDPMQDRLVLVAASSPWQEALVANLKDAGVSPRSAISLDEALQALEFHHPDFFILTEQFACHDDLPDPLLEYVRNLTSRERRELFVIFISRNVKTADHLTAFSQSVNLVLHPDAIQDLIPLTTQSWNFWKNLYQAFIESHIQLTGQ